MRAAVGSRESEVELPEGAVLAQLPRLLSAEYGEHLFDLLGGEEPFGQHIVIVNGQHTALQGLDLVLNEGDTVTIMPPMSGG
jgi:molybdopterin converting factor small subunit